MEHWQEWKDISEFYGDRCANKSGVPLINHIKEGLIILDELGASNDAKKAYCIHPLCQDDDSLSLFYRWMVQSNYSANVILYAMEYRNVANGYLASTTFPLEGIRLSPLREVNLMLIADKVQNRKDFLLYQKQEVLGRDYHIRLQVYFADWLKALGVSASKYKRLVQLINV